MGYYLSSSKTKKDDGPRSRSLDISQYGDGSAQQRSTTDTQYYNASTDASTTTHINFLSDVINRLWPKLNVAGSKLMKDMLEPMFAESLPSMLSTLKFTTLDLGAVPIVIDNIYVHELKTHADTGLEYIQWDWDVSWHSASNIQLATSGNYSMIRLGVKGISLKGRMSFWMQPLSSESLPCVDAIQYAFVNPPEIDLDFTGLANVADFRLAAGVADIKGMIRRILQDVVSSILVLPVKSLFVLNPTRDFRDMHTSSFVGLARITAHSGRGFQPQTRMLRSQDIPDVYLKVSLGYEKTPWRTTTIHNELNPQWDPTTEFHDFLLCSKEQVITIEAYDENPDLIDGGDDYYGKATVTVGQVLLLVKGGGGSGAQKMLEVELIKKEKKGSIQPTGRFVTISLNILPFTTKDMSSLLLADSTADSKKTKNNSSTDTADTNGFGGLLTVLIQQAFDLPVAKKDASSFVKVWYGTQEMGVTGTVTDVCGYDALNPLYQVPFNLLLTAAITDKTAAVKLQLLNQGTNVLGEISIPFERIVTSTNGTVRETAKIGSKGASLAYLVSLAGLCKDAKEIAAASATNSTGPVTSLAGGAVRNATTERIQVSITKGYGFESRRKGPFRKKDIPDAYCVVKFASHPDVWRTVTVKDSVSPVWENETKQFPLQSPNQVISVDVYDANSKSKDEFYGSGRTSVGKILLNGGSLDLEIRRDNKSTGIFITIQCQKL